MNISVTSISIQFFKLVASKFFMLYFLATYANNLSPYAVSFDRNGNVSVQLPAGPSTHSFELTLFVQVYDNLNGYARYTIAKKVIVAINNDFVSGIVNDVLSPNSTLSSFLRSGDTASVSTYIISCSSTLSVLATVSPVKFLKQLTFLLFYCFLFRIFSRNISML